MKIRIFAILLISSSIPIDHAFARNFNSLNIPNEGVHLVISGGWGFFHATDANEITYDYTDKKIEGAINFKAEIARFISPKISASIGLYYISSGLHGRYSNLTIPLRPVEYDYSHTITAIAPEILLKYHFCLLHVDYYFSMGQMICFGEYEYAGRRLDPYPPVRSWSHSASGIGIGISLAGGMRKEINGMLGLELQVGYRYLETGDLSEDGSPFQPPTTLDLSGPFVIAGISCRIH